MRETGLSVQVILSATARIPKIFVFYTKKQRLLTAGYKKRRTLYLRLPLEKKRQRGTQKVTRSLCNISNDN